MILTANFTNTLNMILGCCRSKAVSLREKDAVMGLCYQIGDMYTVHHIWRYMDLEHRKNERDMAWQSGEWANLVIRTGISILYFTAISVSVQC